MVFSAFLLIGPLRLCSFDIRTVVNKGITSQLFLLTLLTWNFSNAKVNSITYILSKLEICFAIPLIGDPIYILLLATIWQREIS